ncbi:hypothetical protein AWB77_04595 [Caballeronia fortuita]|uniref:Uncharacterized protein n=1 Tax=Caballeronia fortuita TaxID=1777138 RepID=A0A158CVI5_9BURK|nr:hypothetical protein [Caballeronia fortuita]SAK86344.1 hypothetical protein AWB77_04595 [Caballeronia fortuita]
MKTEPTPIAAASPVAQDVQDVQRDASYGESAFDASSRAASMSYEDLLPYLLLPMAGSY